MSQATPLHPGQILKRDFLLKLGISQNRLGHAIGVPPNRIHAIVNGTRDVSADTDLRLCAHLNLPEGTFLTHQLHFDLARAKATLAAVLPTIKPHHAART